MKVSNNMQEDLLKHFDEWGDIERSKLAILDLFLSDALLIPTFNTISQDSTITRCRLCYLLQRTLSSICQRKYDESIIGR